MRAAELFTVGVRQADVARRLGVSRQAVSGWYAAWQVGGADALRSRGPSGPTSKVSDAQLRQIEQAMLEGTTANDTLPAGRRIQAAVLVSTGDRDRAEAVSRWWRGSAVVVP